MSARILDDNISAKTFMMYAHTIQLYRFTIQLYPDPLLPIKIVKGVNLMVLLFCTALKLFKQNDDKENFDFILFFPGYIPVNI